MGLRVGQEAGRGREKGITTRMRLSAKKLVRKTKHEQTCTMIGFRADYESHCESSVVVVVFKKKQCLDNAGL